MNTTHGFEGVVVSDHGEERTFCIDRKAHVSWWTIEHDGVQGWEVDRCDCGDQPKNPVVGFKARLVADFLKDGKSRRLVVIHRKDQHGERACIRRYSENDKKTEVPDGYYEAAEPYCDWMNS